MEYMIIGVLLILISILITKVLNTVDLTKKAINPPNRTCPFCISEIPKEATVCRYCQRDVEPYKEPTAQDIISKRRDRENKINNCIKSFEAKYPKTVFKFNKDFQRIEVESDNEQQNNLSKIRQEFISSLKEVGIEANSSFLTNYAIKTIGIMENAMERTVLESKESSSNSKPLTKSEISPKIAKDSKRNEFNIHTIIARDSRRNESDIFAKNAKDNERNKSDSFAKIARGGDNKTLDYSKEFGEKSSRILGYKSSRIFGYIGLVGLVLAITITITIISSSLYRNYKFANVLNTLDEIEKVGDYEGTISAYNEALENTNSSYEKGKVHQKLIDLYMKMGQENEKKLDYKSAIENYNNAFNVSDTISLQQEPRQKLDDLYRKMALEIEPQKSVDLYIEEDYEKAIVNYLTALENNLFADDVKSYSIVEAIVKIAEKIIRREKSLKLNNEYGCSLLYKAVNSWGVSVSYKLPTTTANLYNEECSSDTSH